MFSRMRRWVSAVVAEKKEGSRSSRSLSVVKEKGSGSGSLSCRIEPGKIDRRGAQPGGRPRLHPPHLEAEPLQGEGKFEGGDLAGAARRISRVSDVDQAAEKGPRRDDHGPAGVKDAGLIDHTADPPAIDDQLLHQPLTQVEILLLLHDGFHGKAVELLVALEAGGLDGRPL